MKQKLLTCVTLTLIAQSIFSCVFSQAYRIRIINMIPASQSNEINNDTEPNIAVNPGNPNIIAASAFTFSANRVRPDGTVACDNFPCPDTIGGTNFRHKFMPDCKAPIYLSTDGGETWVLKDMLPSNNGITHDISLAFSDAGYLYAAILKGCQFGRIDSARFNNNLKGFMVLRSSAALDTNRSAESISPLLPVYNWFGVKYDMPWVIAKSASTSGVIKDHVFVGVNYFANARSQVRPSTGFLPQGQSASVMVSNDGTAARVNFVHDTIESYPQRDKNPAGIRLAAHNSGKVYAIFYRASGTEYRTVPTEQCDVVVVRDDDFGRMHFRNLATGSVVERNVTLPLHFLDRNRGHFAGNRITGSDIAIAVDPRNPDHVFAAWCSEDEGVYTLHFRYNTNGGVGEWLPVSENLSSIKRALNPAIAVTNDGRVGFLYQQLSVDSLWETHFIMGQMRNNETGRAEINRRFNPIHDWILSKFHISEFALARNDNRRWLSDYLDLQVAGNTFYGVFAAINTPDQPERRGIPRLRFPAARPIYQREENKLLPVANGIPEVACSIDPFFFKVEPIRR